MTSSTDLMSPTGDAVLVTGASGFVGRRLLPALVDAGHDVRAMTRRPDDFDGPGTVVYGDVTDPDSLFAALRGCRAAYYLVHSLDRADFAARDAEAARNFGRAARQARVGRIVYLGGLGTDEELSPHLRSRQDVESLLAEDGVPVTTLRAGIVIGHGGASWEIVRSVIERIPALAVPRWALTRTQPIAVDDVVRYLVGVLDADTDHASHTYEIGGPDIMRYVDMLGRAAAVRGRPELLVPVPVPALRGLTTYLTAQVLPFATGVDRHTLHTLLGSMRTEVIVHDDSIRRLVPFDPMTYEDAVRAALTERADERRRARA